MPEIHATSASDAEAASKPEACRCHEAVMRPPEEFPGCQCHLDARKNIPRLFPPARLPELLPQEVRDRGTERRPPPPEPKAVGRGVGAPDRSLGRLLSELLRGTILAAFLVGGAAFVLFALVPVVTVALALALLALSPMILWGLFVFVTVDMDRPSAGRVPTAPAEKTYADRLPASVLRGP